MSFASPFALLFLLALLGLWWLTIRARRRRSLTIGATLIWQRVLSAAAPKARKKIDPIFILLALALAIATLGAASPEVESGALRPQVVVIYDAGNGGSLAGLNKETLSKGYQDHLPEGTNFVPFGQAGSNADTATLKAVMAANPAHSYLVVSPMKLGELPANCQQVCPRFKQKSLPFTHIDIGPQGVYARAATEGQTIKWEVGDQGATLASATRDFLLNPVAHDAALVLQPTEGNSISLPPRDAFTLALEGRESEDLGKALKVAFDGLIAIAPSGQRADFRLAETKATGPSLRIERDGLRTIVGDAHSSLIDEASAFFDRMPNDWLTPFPGHALPEVSTGEYRNILTIQSVSGTYPIIRWREGGVIETSIDLFGEYRRSSWLPLFVAAAIQESTGEKILEYGHWLVPDGMALAPERHLLMEELPEYPKAFPLVSARQSLGIWLLGLAFLPLLWLFWSQKRWLLGSDGGR